MTENGGFNSPNPLKYGTPRTPRDSSSSDLTVATQRQEEVLARQRKMNESILEYKKKVEDGIASYQEKLREERKRTNDVLNDLAERHQKDLKDAQEKGEHELKMLSDKPLFDKEEVEALRARVTAMRAQNVQLKKAFTRAFAELIEEFNDNKVIALKVCNKSMEKLMESSNEIKERVEVLQHKIDDKCSSIKKAVMSVHSTPRARLQIGSSLEVEKPIDETPAPRIGQPQTIERKQILCVSPFLSRCLAMYDQIITH